jgi:uncharacterized protein YeaO (DUF488 family)
VRTIRLKRAYAPVDRVDGSRILVERLWPRGLSKERARIDWWAKDTAPSTELRKWFGHDPERWDEFRRRYHAELDGRPEAVRELLDHTRDDDVTLVYASKEEQYNAAVALKTYIEGVK